MSIFDPPPVMLACPQCGACEGDDVFACPFCGADTVPADDSQSRGDSAALLPDEPPVS